MSTSPRDAIRAAILNQRPKSRLVSLFGQQVEIRQPSLGTVLNLKERPEDEQATVFLTDYTYVPETDEKVFEPGDVAQLMALPFGEELKNFLDEVNSLLGVNTQEVTASVDDAMKTD